MDVPDAWATSRGANVTVAVVDTGVDTVHPDLADQIDTPLAQLRGRQLRGPDRRPRRARHEDRRRDRGAGQQRRHDRRRARTRTCSCCARSAPRAPATRPRSPPRSTTPATSASRSSTPPSTVPAPRRRSSRRSRATPARCSSSPPATTTGPTTTPSRPTPATCRPPTWSASARRPDADAPADFSNVGAHSVDLFAPGADVLAPVLANGSFEHTWWYTSGTSIAAANVAGVAALALAAAPALTTAQLKAAILDSGDALSALSGLSVTGRRANAARAVTFAEATPLAEDAPPAPLAPRRAGASRAAGRRARARRARRDGAGRPRGDPRRRLLPRPAPRPPRDGERTRRPRRDPLAADRAPPLLRHPLRMAHGRRAHRQGTDARLADPAARRRPLPRDGGGALDGRRGEAAAARLHGPVACAAAWPPPTLRPAVSASSPSATRSPTAAASCSGAWRCSLGAVDRARARPAVHGLRARRRAGGRPRRRAARRLRGRRGDGRALRRRRLYVGVNDVRALDWDADAFARDHARALATLSERCDRVLCVTLPADLGRPRGAHVEAGNAIVLANARAAGALVLDLRDFRGREPGDGRPRPPDGVRAARDRRARARRARRRRAPGAALARPTLIAYETTRIGRLRGDVTYAYRHAKISARAAWIRARVARARRAA